MLTVLIPAWRSADTVVRAIESIRSNSGPIPVIVVIDGQGDPTEGLVRRRDDVTVIVNEANLGTPAARNRGLSIVQTEYVTSLDADDYIEGRLHAGMVDALERSNADMVFAPWSWERPNTRRIDIGTEAVDLILEDRDSLVEYWMEMSAPVNGAVAWRTKALRNIGGWFEGLVKGDDYEVGLRSLVRGLTVTRSEEGRLVYVHHDGPGRISERSDSLAMRDFDYIFSLAEDFASTSARGERIRRALGRRHYMMASQSFYAGEYRAGRRFLSEARRLGFTGHSGDPMHRAITALIGLEGRQRLSRALMPLKQFMRR